MKGSGGTYALVLYVPKAKAIRVGALGTFRFPRGNFVYVGSALGGLDNRISRHLRRKKKVFWHIDYLMPHARLVDVWTRSGKRRLECVWAQAALALPNARVVVPRFGSSDCRCATHLIYLASERASRSLRGKALAG